MTVQETVQQLQHTPLSYRIQVIELLVQSLKEEITQSASAQTVREPFRVQSVDLGADVSVDRNEMDGDRGVCTCGMDTKGRRSTNGSPATSTSSIPPKIN